MNHWKLMVTTLGLLGGLLACDGTTAADKSAGSGESGTSVGDDDDDNGGGIEPCIGDDCVCETSGCDVDCSGTADCDVACNDADPCDVDCNGAPSCDVNANGGNVTVACDGSNCDVVCNGADSCSVDCANGACDVVCPASGCEVTNCGANCTVLCGVIPQFPSGGTVTCD